MKRCSCLRYFTLVSGKKDESIYTFIDGKLIPVESVFPLEDFETGTGALICICPYYNHIHEGRLIHRAFERLLKKQLNKEDNEIIKEAVKNCEYCVESKGYLIFSERYKEIINGFCEKYDLKLTWRLLKHFLSFLKVRNNFMNKDLCAGVSAQEKKKCFDELWVESFGKYLESVGFDVVK